MYASMMPELAGGGDVGQKLTRMRADTARYRTPPSRRAPAVATGSVIGGCAAGVAVVFTREFITCPELAGGLGQHRGGSHAVMNRA